MSRSCITDLIKSSSKWASAYESEQVKKTLRALEKHPKIPNNRAENIRSLTLFTLTILARLENCSSPNIKRIIDLILNLQARQPVNHAAFSDWISSLYYLNDRDIGNLFKPGLENYLSVTELNILHTNVKHYISVMNLFNRAQDISKMWGIGGILGTSTPTGIANIVNEGKATYDSLPPAYPIFASDQDRIDIQVKIERLLTIMNAHAVSRLRANRSGAEVQRKLYSDIKLFAQDTSATLITDPRLRNQYTKAFPTDAADSGWIIDDPGFTPNKHKVISCFQYIEHYGLCRSTDTPRIHKIARLMSKLRNAYIHRLLSDDRREHFEYLINLPIPTLKSLLSFSVEDFITIKQLDDAINCLTTLCNDYEYREIKRNLTGMLSYTPQQITQISGLSADDKALLSRAHAWADCFSIGLPTCIATLRQIEEEGIVDSSTDWKLCRYYLISYTQLSEDEKSIFDTLTDRQKSDTVVAPIETQKALLNLDPDHARFTANMLSNSIVISNAPQHRRTEQEKLEFVHHILSREQAMCPHWCKMLAYINLNFANEVQQISETPTPHHNQTAWNMLCELKFEDTLSLLSDSRELEKIQCLQYLTELINKIESKRPSRSAQSSRLGGFSIGGLYSLFQSKDATIHGSADIQAIRLPSHIPTRSASHTGAAKDQLEAALQALAMVASNHFRRSQPDGPEDIFQKMTKSSWNDRILDDGSSSDYNSDLEDDDDTAGKKAESVLPHHSVHR